MSSIKILNDEHWHQIRRKYVGASESAALFGLLPWLTPWTLHMYKTGKLPAPDIEDVKHVKQGKFFEPAIASWAEQKFGITLNKVRRYEVADDCPGMGSSKDYEQVGTGKRVPTEIKWVVRAGENWEYDGDIITLAPDYYVIQCQHQMGCDDYSEQSQIIAFIDGDVRRMVIDRRPAMIDLIKAKVRAFWADISAGKEPPIDFKADADAVLQYAKLSPVRSITMTPEIAAMASVAMDWAEIGKNAEIEERAVKAKLAHLMLEEARKLGANDEDGKVVCENETYRVSNSLVGAYEGQLVTEEMLGTRLGARDSYRRITISKPKPKKGKKAAQ